MRTWRQIARPIINQVLKENESEQDKKKALLEAYPFGERKYHPYRIWLDEIKRQRGLKKPIRDDYPPNPNQIKMFK